MEGDWKGQRSYPQGNHRTAVRHTRKTHCRILNGQRISDWILRAGSGIFEKERRVMQNHAIKTGAAI
jgi:hypothetical protein